MQSARLNAGRFILHGQAVTAAASSGHHLLRL
jgi:hypothetical protein